MKKNISMIAAAILLSALTETYADNIAWINTAGGSFQDAANWNPNTVPGTTDYVQFRSSGTYTLTLAEDTDVAGIDAKTGSYAVTLDLNGYSLTTSNSTPGTLNLGTSGASLTDFSVMSSAPGGEFNLFRLVLYNIPNASGNVLITGSNTSVNVTRDSTSDNFVGYQGSNTTFTVADGAHFTATKSLIFGIGVYGNNTPQTGIPDLSPKATLTVTDPGTTFTNIAGCIIGKAGTNMPTMIVANEAMCTAPSFNVGSGGDTWYSYSPKANGKLVVTGTNSYVETGYVSMSALAGEFGTEGSTAGGYLVIEKGGKLKATNFLTISGGLNHYYPSSNVRPGSVTNLNAYGEVIVRNPGSELYVANYIQLTTAAKGALYILDGATLTCGASAPLYLSYGYVGASVTGTTFNQPAFTNINAYGLFVISNANSSASLNNVRFGEYGCYGDLIVADNARLSATNGTGGYIRLTGRSRLTVSDAFVETPTLTTVSNSTIRIELGARDHADAYIKTTTTANLNAFAELEIGVLDNASITPGDTVTLLRYTGSRTGTFKDLPEGAAFFVDGHRFQIYYGDGSNDAITLKFVPLGTMILVR